MKKFKVLFIDIFKENVIASKKNNKLTFLLKMSDNCFNVYFLALCQTLLLVSTPDFALHQKLKQTFA